MRAWICALMFVAIGCESAALGPADSGDADRSPPADLGEADAGHPDDLGPADRRDLGQRDGGQTDAGPQDLGAALGPPYPLVLAHGFFGFEDFAGAGFLRYFYEVRPALQAQGETLVFTPAVDPFNDSTARGGQLIAHIEDILAQTGHAKVNLIGHSQGGLDARVVANLRPDLVASVTTIATPHRGSRLADISARLVQDNSFAGVVDALARVIGAPLYDEVGAETSVVSALRQLTSAGMETFNRTFPSSPSVAYYSIAGRSDRTLGGQLCQPQGGGPAFVSRYDSVRDPIDPLLALGESVLDGDLLDPEPNDGLVRVSDARWGTFLGCIPADHLDQVGQLLGDSPGFRNDFDYLEFYEELVAWLRIQGY